MGIFSKKNTGENPVYVNQEELPVAVAVTADPEVPAQQQQQHTIKTYKATTNSNAAPPFQISSRHPTVIPQCPHCSQTNVRTHIITKPDFLTWMAVIVMIVVFWPLFWLPLVLDQCRRTTHLCSSCHSKVGDIPPFHDCCVKHR